MSYFDSRARRAMSGTLKRARPDPARPDSPADPYTRTQSVGRYDYSRLENSSRYGIGYYASCESGDLYAAGSRYDSYDLIRSDRSLFRSDRSLEDYDYYDLSYYDPYRIYEYDPMMISYEQTRNRSYNPIVSSDRLYRPAGSDIVVPGSDRIVVERTAGSDRDGSSRYLASRFCASDRQLSPKINKSDRPTADRMIQERMKPRRIGSGQVGSGRIGSDRVISVVNEYDKERKRRV